jgi:hypothetical protein
MNSLRVRAAVGFLVLLVLCLLGRLMHFFPFAPVVTRWSLQEDYVHGQIPKTGSVNQSHCARSDTGILIGSDGPGFIEWKFSRPGPFPTVVQPFFIPLSDQPCRITLWTPKVPEPRVLYQNFSLRNRPFDLSALVRDEKVYTLRFEGTQALLEDIRFYELLQLPPFPWAVLLVAALLTVVVLGRRNWPELVILGLALIGFYFRWRTFLTYYSLPLEGDATGYWSLGHAFQWKHPLMTGSREPGFIWMVYMARLAFGDSIRSLRFMCILISTLLIPFTAEVARAAKWPLWVGVGAAALVATNPFAVFFSVQGYQLEFFTILILLFSIAWLIDHEQTMGWLGGLLCVTRVQSFIAVIPLVGLADWKCRWHRRKRLQFWIPFLIITLPYLIAVRQGTGSVFGHVNQYVRDAWMRRQTAALVRGYTKILFDPTDPYNRIFLNSHYERSWNLLFLPFFWIGIVVCLKNSKDRWFLWLPLIFLSGLPMLHDVIREPRLLFHVEPFVALITARGIWFINSARRES